MRFIKRILSGKRVLLLMGAPSYHDQVYHYAELAGILCYEGGLDVRITQDLNVLNPPELAQYDAVMNWSTFAEPTEDQVQALLDAIKSGTGFFGLHGATATFWNNQAYLDMIGSKFKVHDPFKTFMVRIEDDEHPITSRFSDFPIEDELYELEGDLSSLTVLASAEGHPLLYTKNYGKGRVHYNALGHDWRALQNASLRQLILEGLAWVLKLS